MRFKILFNHIFAVTLVGAMTITTTFAQTYKADVPKSITTPDSVETRIGKLTFFDGLPDKETVQKVYDNLDFSRGVEAFMAGMAAAAVYAACRGLDEIGVKANRGVGISESLLDARSLFLTAIRLRSITSSASISRTGRLLWKLRQAYSEWSTTRIFAM